MRTRQLVFISVLSSLVTIIAMLAIWFGAGQVAAQRQVAPSGEGNTTSATRIPSEPLNGDGSTNHGEVTNAFVDSGPDVAAAPLYSYYHILGSQLLPRDSSTTYEYDSYGCIHVTGGSNTRLSFPLNIPENSVIKYVRIYYKDTSATSDMQVWLSRLTPGTTNFDLVDVSSTGSGGLGSALSSEITHTVTGGLYQYTLSYGWGTRDNTNQICGIRVAYYAPNMAATFLPLVRGD